MGNARLSGQMDQRFRDREGAARDQPLASWAEGDATLNKILKVRLKVIFQAEMMAFVSLMLTLAWLTFIDPFWNHWKFDIEIAIKE
jgi:hypothetical protein